MGGAASTATIYQDLCDADSLAFRQAWFENKDFQFTTSRRKIQKIHESSTAENGRWVSLIQMESHFAGGLAPSEESRRQAANYVNCIREQFPQMVTHNSMTEAENFLLVERLRIESACHPKPKSPD